MTATMTTILAVLVFLVIGALVGFLGTRLFAGLNTLAGVVLGVAGSFAGSWIAKLLGMGTGFLSFSLWGVVFGIIGACLFVVIYGLIAHRRVTA